MTAVQPRTRDGRFASPDWSGWDVPPIPVPVRVAEAGPLSVDALGRPAPSCGVHIATWAVYTDPSGRPACKLCDSSRRTRRAR